MIKFESKLISTFCLITFVFCLVFGSFNLELNALTNNQNDQLIERISKDFSKKFCNGVAFGLSEESAMNFAIKENSAIFYKKRGIENVEKEILAESVSIKIVDKCGYQLNLLDEQWVAKFQEAYFD